jgi:hypothetical protein
MAKCPVCNTRKGKRKCAIVNNDFVCSLCCGNTRKEELCLDCVFYQPPQYDYDEVPAFSATVLVNNHALQNYSHLIENTFAAANSQDAIAMIELLINKYYFKELEIKSENLVWQSGFEAAVKVIQNELQDIDAETFINLLGAMRFAVKDKIKHQE